MADHRPRIAHLMTSVALGALIATSSPALAQEGDGVFTMLSRVIFGAGNPKVAIDTPQAVTVLDQEDLDREQARTVGELFDGVPGVQIAGSQRVTGQAFNIRGIGATEQTASEARIIVTVDGAPKFYEQYRMGSFFSDVELYKRVEILRGPASSTLYGSGAIGGVVAFTTKDASDFLTEGKTGALRFKTGYDSNGDGFLGSVIYAGKLGTNGEILTSLNFRRSGDVEDGDGVALSGSAFDAISGLVKGTWRLGDNDDQTLRLSVQRWDSDLDDTDVASTGTSAFFGTVDRHTVDTTVILNYANAVSDNPWLDYNVALSYTETAVEQSDFSLGAFCSPGTFQVLCDTNYAYRTLSLKAENKVDLSTAEWENFLTFGMQVSQQDRVADSSQGALGFHPEGTDTKLGVYAQGELVWNDKLTLIPGIRVDFGDREPGSGVPGAETVSDTAISPKLAMMYDFNDQWGVFGSVARTERMPTLDELYSSSATKAAALSLEKETANTIELGFKYSTSGLLSDGDTLQLKTTAFHNDIDNLIAVTPATDTVFFRNVGQAEIWGAELEAAYQSDRFFGQLAFSSIKGKDKQYDYTLATIPAEALAITVGAKAPKLNLEYGVRANFVDSISTSSRSATTGIITTTDYSAYNTNDIFVTWKPDTGAMAGFDVRFAVENVFDETYRNNLAQDNGDGRTFKVSLAKTLDW